MIHHELTLAGCRTDPLGSYLKALGLFRIAAQQADPTARCAWSGDTFQLTSTLDENGVVELLLDHYEPSAGLAPWNSDAGFKAGRSSATKTLLAVEASDDPRLRGYQRAIAVVRDLMTRPDWAELDKEAQVSLLRSTLPDDALDWIDAAVVLRQDRAAFPLLLGSGGNLGRLDLSPNFMDRLLVVLDPGARERSLTWLRYSLFAEGSPPLRTDSAGQYDPGAAGGVRAGAVGKPDPLTNPWDFVLLIEGTLLWAAGVARRLGGSTNHASMPFTVEATASGYAAVAAGEAVRGEIWAPVWTAPIDLPALRRLFAEGRISWSGSQARTGLDAVRALSTYGVDAGLDRFVRHVVAQRHGQSPLAVPVGSHLVRAIPGVELLGDLDGWTSQLDRVARSDGAPAGVAAAFQRLQRAMFTAAAAPAGQLGSRLQEVLVAVAEADGQLGRSGSIRREGKIPPAPWLEPRRWLPAIDDGSAELRVAASLAIARDQATLDPREATLRSLLTPVRFRSGRRRGHTDRFAHPVWSTEPAPLVGFGARPLPAVLADALARRGCTERAADPAGQMAASAFPQSLDARSGDAEALAAGALDMARVQRLLLGLLLLRPDPFGIDHRWRDQPPPNAVSPSWRLLAPFYTRHRAALDARADPDDLRASPRWGALLAQGRAHTVLADATTRLKMAGVRPAVRSPEVMAAGTDAHLLAASVLVGTPIADLRRALDHIAVPGREGANP